MNIGEMKTKEEIIELLKQELLDTRYYDISARQDRDTWLIEMKDINKEGIVEKAKKLAYEGKLPEGYNYGIDCSRIADVLQVVDGGDVIIIADRHGSLYRTTFDVIKQMVDDFE